MQSLKLMATAVVLCSSRKELGMKEGEKLSDRIPHHLAEELMVGLKTVWPLSGRVLMMTAVRHGRLAIVRRLMLVEEQLLTVAVIEVMASVPQNVPVIVPPRA